MLMEIPHNNPGELELDPLQFLPTPIQLDHETVMEIDFKFRHFSSEYDLSRGLPIMKAIPFEATIGGTAYDDCKALFIQDDCMVVEYGQTEHPDEINVMVVREDIADHVRPIQLTLTQSIASSVDARDIIYKFRATDDLLRNLENIVERA